MSTDPALANSTLDLFLSTLVSLMQDIVQLMRDIVLFEYNGVTMTFFDFLFALVLIDFFFLFYLLMRR